MGAAICATASTGVGIIAAIKMVMGFAALATATVLQVALTICAAGFFLESWERTGSFDKAGFKVNGFSIGTATICYGVKGL